jgi:hypothetical protein
VVGKQPKVLRKPCGTSASPTMTRNNASASAASEPSTSALYAMIAAVVSAVFVGAKVVINIIVLHSE